MNYRTCWLTVNRECNLRCKWCYAQGTHYNKNDNMDIELAYKIVDICKELDIKHITIIGGEPTLYPHLQTLIKYIHGKNMNCGFVTNGLKLKDEQYVKELLNCGIKQFSISLKGEDKNSFKEVTGCDVYEQILQGVENCLKNNANVSISMVLTEENIETYLKGIKHMKEMGVKYFHFSFCYEFDSVGNCEDYLKHHNPKKIIAKFVESYPELDKITEHRFRLSQSYPMCLWDKKIIEKMNRRNQITSVCQLLGKSGLLFDTEGNIIPCNAMHEIKLGKINEDFNDAKELVKHTQKGEFKQIYDKLCGVPDMKCLECDELKYCGGGCVCQWTKYNFEELMDCEME